MALALFVSSARVDKTAVSVAERRLAVCAEPMVTAVLRLSDRSLDEGLGSSIAAPATRGSLHGSPLGSLRSSFSQRISTDTDHCSVDLPDITEGTETDCGVDKIGGSEAEYSDVVGSGETDRVGDTEGRGGADCAGNITEGTETDCSVDKIGGSEAERSDVIGSGETDRAGDVAGSGETDRTVNIMHGIVTDYGVDKIGGSKAERCDVIGSGETDRAAGTEGSGETDRTADITEGVETDYNVGGSEPERGDVVEGIEADRSVDIAGGGDADRTVADVEIPDADAVPGTEGELRRLFVNQ